MALERTIRICRSLGIVALGNFAQGVFHLYVAWVRWDPHVIIHPR
jgi:hypothetical protein